MKKQFFGVILIACFVLVLFNGCSQESLVSDTASAGATTPITTERASLEPGITATPTMNQTAEPSEPAAVAGELKIEGVDFDQASNDYLDGDALSALEKMSPLLLSAAMAEFSINKPLYPDENSDTSFEWAMIYQYINSYGDENTKLEKLEDGSLVVPEDEINQYFNSFFSSFNGSAPSLNTDFAIKYDESSKSYTVGRSDFGDISFTVTGVSLSKENNAADPSISATVALTALDPDGVSAGVILVEIVPKADTMYGYSIQSVEME